MTMNSRFSFWRGVAAPAALWLYAAATAQANDAPREPLPPGNAAPTLRLPQRDGSGEFVTPNRDLHGERAFWNLRIALNVAAIGCRGARAGELVADYNRLLGRHAPLVRSSETQVITQLARQSGSNGIAARDKLSTRLFNYFAQPPAQAEFCQQAADVASELADSSADHARLSAAAMLSKLDQPFVDFYHAYDRYQVEWTAWKALTGTSGARSDDVRQASLGHSQ
jgi:hypothetical protein